MPLGLPRERRLLRADQRPRAERGAQARAVSVELDVERRLLRRDAQALTKPPAYFAGPFGLRPTLILASQ